MRIAAVSVVTTALVVLGSGSALAEECHGDNGDFSGSNVRHVVASSNQFGEWYEHQATAKSGVSATTNNDMPANRCEDAKFDWMTYSGHYDNRTARDCDPGSSVTSDPSGDGWVLEPVGWGGKALGGMQKAAGCTYNFNSKPVSFPNCNYFPESYGGTGVCQFLVALVWNDPAQRTWFRNSDHTVHYNSGGATGDPDA